MTEKKPTSASAWRAQATPLVTLPSGVEVELKRPDLEAYMLKGELPQTLSEIAYGVGKKIAMKGGVDLDDVSKELKSESDEDVRKTTNETLEFKRKLTKETVVNPKVILEGEAGEGEILISDIPVQDRDFIYHYAMTGSTTLPVKMRGGEVPHEALETFPEGPEGVSFDLGRGGDEVQEITQ